MCKDQVEPRFHFCHCTHTKDHRTQITNRVLAALNAHLLSPINTVPVFWAAEQRHQYNTHETRLWAEIEQHPPERSAMGIIPKAFTRFLESLRWKPQTDIEALIANIQITIVKGHHAAWIDRCKAFSKENKREDGGRASRVLQARAEKRRRQERRTNTRSLQDHTAQTTPLQQQPKRRRRKGGTQDAP